MAAALQDSIERRDNRRIPMSLETSLHYSSVLLLNCSTRDLSLDGVFVETRGEVLPESAIVEVGIVVHNNGEVRRTRLPAQVMRIADDGIALKFRYPDYIGYSTLVDLIYP